MTQPAGEPTPLILTNASLMIDDKELACVAIARRALARRLGDDPGHVLRVQGLPRRRQVVASSRRCTSPSTSASPRRPSTPSGPPTRPTESTAVVPGRRLPRPARVGDQPGVDGRGDPAAVVADQRRRRRRLHRRPRVVDRRGARQEHRPRPVGQEPHPCPTRASTSRSAGVRQLSAGTRQLFREHRPGHRQRRRPRVGRADRRHHPLPGAGQDRRPAGLGARRDARQDRLGRDGRRPALRRLDRVRDMGRPQGPAPRPLRLPDGQADRAGVRQALRDRDRRARSGA